jgi:hypothetical protein
MFGNLARSAAVVLLFQHEQVLLRVDLVVLPQHLLPCTRPTPPAHRSICPGRTGNDDYSRPTPRTFSSSVLSVLGQQPVVLGRLLVTLEVLRRLSCHSSGRAVCADSDAGCRPASAHAEAGRVRAGKIKPPVVSVDVSNLIHPSPTGRGRTTAATGAGHQDGRRVGSELPSTVTGHDVTPCRKRRVVGVRDYASPAVRPPMTNLVADSTRRSRAIGRTLAPAVPAGTNLPRFAPAVWA